MKDPLKQGLKHEYGNRLEMRYVRVEVKDPLKQGLKLIKDPATDRVYNG